jgi:hypothetical protein
MLLLKGDYAGAAAKFAEAHRIGPHFADPLEMWGEALVYSGKTGEAQKQFTIAAALDLSQSDKAVLARAAMRQRN